MVNIWLKEIGSKEPGMMIPSDIFVLIYHNNKKINKIHWNLCKGTLLFILF